ncbi:alanine--tRNA ligase, partial [Patescibacteria group bacterium]|nr:alanine--tRNA ligase [Patescibacteria group bacterium]
YKDVYPELDKKREFVIKNIVEEEEKFSRTIERGLKEFEKVAGGKISGMDAFNLYQSYGFPIEMTRELAEEKELEVDENGFGEELKKHQELSRTASAGEFKGGLADVGEETKKLHTAAHLLLAALRKVLGEGVEQKGSNITAERLRFDFSYSDKMTDEQKKEVEDLVNEAIKKDLPVVCEVGVFESKYGEKVRVYSISDFSKEICGGPHAGRTGELGGFKIAKEQSSSAGVRRIKAVLK